MMEDKYTDYDESFEKHGYSTQEIKDNEFVDIEDEEYADDEDDFDDAYDDYSDDDK